MKTATKIAQRTLIVSGALLLVLGVIIWTGKADGLIGIHALLGLLLILAVWTIAAIAARAGVSITLVTLTVLWSLVAMYLADAQERLVTGGWHWTIQLLHLVVGMTVIGSGQLLALKIRRKLAAKDSIALPDQGSTGYERSDSRRV